MVNQTGVKREAEIIGSGHSPVLEAGIKREARIAGSGHCPVEKYINRYELKYLISYDKKDILRNQIELYCKKDRFQKGDNYKVTSIYFDTDDYCFYREKIDGIKIRRKLRYRYYNNDKDNGFLEIKKKYNTNVIKIRTDMSETELKEHYDFKEKKFVTEFYNSIQPDFSFMFNHYRNKIRHNLTVMYNREAYESLYNDYVRITFDYDLKCEVDNTDKNFFLNNDMCIMELKFNHSIPLWLLEIIHNNGLKLNKISKYCEAFDFLLLCQKQQ
jgi:hypothetical protein